MQEVQVFNCLFQPGGDAGNLTTFPLHTGARIIDAVEFVIADGNRGAVSFALGMHGTPIIPFNSGGFITGDDETIHWELSGYPDSGAWELYGFNLGTFPHSIGVRFLCSLPQRPGVQIVQPLGLAGLTP